MRALLAGCLVLFACAASAADATGLVTRVLWRARDAGVMCYRIPALCTAPNGDLIAVCDARTKGGGDLNSYQQIRIAIRRSKDGGRTWTAPDYVWTGRWDETEQWSGSDPSLIVDRVARKVFLLFNAWEWKRRKGVYQFFVMESSDGGASWSAARNITSMLSVADWDVGGVHQLFIASGSGTQLRDGTLAHMIVRLWNRGRPTEAAVFGSEDHGRTWRVFGKPVAHADESKIVELADGGWLVNARDEPGARTIHRSADRGETWTTTVDRGLPDPRCNAQLIRAGEALVFSNCASTNTRKRCDLTVRVSRDEGRTWNAGLLVCPGSSGYSDLTETASGDIGVLYERDRCHEVVYTLIPRAFFSEL